MPYHSEMLYKVLIDEVEQQQWRESAEKFSDYSIYQTWSYQELRANTEGQEISRILIKDDEDEIVMMSHVRIKRVLPLGLKIGYIQCGPLIFKKDRTCHCTVEALKMLRQAYLGTRVNVLRIMPNIFNNNANQRFIEMFNASGFEHSHYILPYHTLILPLGCSSETLRKGLHQKWRKKLRKAEKAEVEVVEQSDERSFKVLEVFYRQLRERKGFKGVDPEIFARSQSALPDTEKMNVIVAYLNGEPVTVHVTSNLGDTAIALSVAANEKGYSCWSSYLAWWKALTISNEMGMKKYDFGGVNFESNPTVSRFKAGMGGEEQFHIGAFDAYTNFVVKGIFRKVDMLYAKIKK